VRPLDDYDYLYVDIPEVNLEDPEEAAAFFPWTGRRAYCLGAVVYMLQQGLICNDNIVYGIRASRRLEPSS
jgi:hypothetical protein